jgi:hypothetical protein
MKRKAEEKERDSSSGAAPVPLQCVVCAQNDEHGQSKGKQASYKCPRCRLPYCSAACCKVHKEQCAGAVGAIKKKEVVARTMTSDIVILKPEQLLRLENSQELKQSLLSKRLRDDLAAIDCAPDRAEALRKFRRNNVEFEEFVQKLLETVGPR